MVRRFVCSDGAALSHMEAALAQIRDHHGVRRSRHAQRRPARRAKTLRGKPGHQRALFMKPLMNPLNRRHKSC